MRTSEEVHTKASHTTVHGTLHSSRQCIEGSAYITAFDTIHVLALLAMGSVTKRAVTKRASAEEEEAEGKLENYQRDYKN